VKYDSELFDEQSQEIANTNVLKRTSDLKYYLMVVAFLGIGYIVITKFQKK
jgi:hypothetical protein|tara:strand:- start:109 stop:261 length:153 start_codon:yes stop_codon:yes gene_type:complete